MWENKLLGDRAPEFAYLRCPRVIFLLAYAVETLSLARCIANCFVFSACLGKYVYEDKLLVLVFKNTNAGVFRLNVHRVAT